MAEVAGHEWSWHPPAPALKLTHAHRQGTLLCIAEAVGTQSSHFPAAFPKQRTKPGPHTLQLKPAGAYSPDRDTT